MKNLFTVLLLLTIIGSFNLMARNIEINSAAALQTSFNGGQDGDTLLLMPGVYNTGKNLRIPEVGAIVLKSFYEDKDSMATIIMEVSAAADVSDLAHPTKPSLIFENLHLQGRSGTYTGGTYLFSLKQRYFSIDTLAFRNCEISNVARSVLRSESPADSSSCGTLEWLEMTNCLVHRMNGSTDIWPVLYCAYIPMYVVIKNNTFYDMPYAKTIFQMAHMSNETGRNAEIYFENNTVVTTWSRAEGLISTTTFLSEEALYYINNNMLLIPNWSNELNMPADDAAYTIPPVIRCRGGIIQAQNNIVDSLRPWLSGQVLDADLQGGFLDCDSIPTYKMKDLEFGWNDFANPQGGDFTFLSTKKPATSGNNGGPIGDPRWVKTLINPRTLSASFTPDSIDAVITPGRAFYEDGETVTVTASAVDGYTFNGWKKVSDNTLVSTDNPYSFTINSDVEIFADYSPLIERNVSITINGSISASYTISPDKTVYFEGDEITITLDTHNLNSFIGWSDSNTDLTRTITISGNDINLTANFNEYPYVVAWDFSHLTANNQTYSNLAANFAKDAANPGVMNYVQLDTIRTISTRNNKFTGFEVNNCLARRTHQDNFGNPDYPFIKFSTNGLSNLRVESYIATDNSIFKIQKLQYSLNGTNYNDFAIDTINANNFLTTWMPFNGVLPSEANNKDSVFVRWIADTSSERLFAPGQETSNTEYAYISRITVIDNTFTSAKEAKITNDVEIYSVDDKLFIQSHKAGIAELYSVMGQKINEIILNPGINHITGLSKGVYIIKIGAVTEKVLVK
ncbi:MAG: hypothetical protein JW717_03945 [Marinilabiliaceae bacterium]|nr:hypothetical protein [Marinilabiliaceae bacterium]